jgi:ATP-dependent Clp protease ATP-binding subunit ClpA
MMDANRLTQKVQEALNAAQAKAIRLSHQQVDVEHLLSALMEQERGLAPSILQKSALISGAANAASTKSWSAYRKSRRHQGRQIKFTSPGG